MPVGIVTYQTGTQSEVNLMRSMVFIRGLGGTPEKKVTELNERIAEKEGEG